MEPITVFGPYVAKAMGLSGELVEVTKIWYEAAPGYLVHLRITVLDDAENTDAWMSDKSKHRRVLRINYTFTHESTKLHAVI